MEHHRKIDAFAPECHCLSEAVVVDSMNFVCIGNSMSGSMNSKTNYFGEVKSEWRP